MNNQKTEILAAVSEFVQQQIGNTAEELMGQNVLMLGKLNARFGSGIVREVLKEMAGETSSPFAPDGGLLRGLPTQAI